MNIPTHIAIIMDGNGRWAKNRGLPRTVGHERGAKVAEDVIEWAANLGVKYLTLYAFSTENWKRPKEEVQYLFSLLVRYIESRFNKIMKKGVRLRFLGRINELPNNVIEMCKRVEEKSKGNTKIQVIIALNYGGRQEIIDAINKMLMDKIDKVDLDTFRNYLYFPDVPDPDLVIRTSGEIRISNFLLWQIAYSELYFTEVLWPDFNKEEFLKAIEYYKRRERRYGGIKGV